MQKAANTISFFLLAFFGVAVGLYAFGYYAMDFPFLQTKGTLPQETYWNIAFYTHVGSGGIALAIGWLQFWKKFRLQNINRHRLVGKIYVISILLFASTSGQFLAWYANSGFPARLGFACLSFAWFFTTLKGYLAIRRNDIVNHRRWMIRSYAVTFAAVMLRIWLPLFWLGLKFSEHDAYIAVSWFCWVPNLLFAEWFVLNRQKPAA